MKVSRLICALVVTGCAIISSTESRAAAKAEFDALSKEATRNAKTPEGQRYYDKFLDAVDSAMRAAMDACVNKRLPNTKSGHPGEVLFVIGADGRVKRVLYSENIPFAVCVGSKLRSVSKLPPPPRDSYAIGVGVAKH